MLNTLGVTNIGCPMLKKYVNYLLGFLVLGSSLPGAVFVVFFFAADLVMMINKVRYHFALNLRSHFACIYLYVRSQHLKY